MLLTTVHILNSVHSKVFGAFVDFFGLCTDTCEELFLPSHILGLLVKRITSVNELVLSNDVVKIDLDGGC